MPEHLDPERAQMDLTASLTAVRMNLRKIQKCDKDERIKELAKNYRNQTLQIARAAEEIYLALK